MLTGNIESKKSIHGNREIAVAKILYHNCGCTKFKCLVKGKIDLKPCTRACDGCNEAVVIDSCAKHAGPLANLRDRVVTGFEYVS